MLRDYHMHKHQYREPKTRATKHKGWIQQSLGRLLEQWIFESLVRTRTKSHFTPSAKSNTAILPLIYRTTRLFKPILFPLALSTVL